MNQTRRSFLTQAAAAGAALSLSHGARGAEARRPNILFAIADDWSWPHASIGGTKAVHTPAFDRCAREGCLFTNAFTAAPQCSPNRAATLTGRHIWQLAEAGTHASIFPTTYPVYPDLLESAGYHVGYTGKAWGPGDWKRGGWPRNPAGNEYNNLNLESVPASGILKTDYAGNFDRFLADRKGDAPFCFWYGGKEPHRKYEYESGSKAGKQIGDVDVPPYLPDDPVVRNDFLDYFFEIEWFDKHLAAMMASLERIGELDNTIIVVTGDNGMSFPRAKANMYEPGIHVPLTVRWPAAMTAGRVEEGLVSFVDFAPTFLAAAGVAAPDTMTGVNLLPWWKGEADAPNAHVLSGRERHTHARFDNLGYPSRAIRTADFLYIHNMKPDRWPAGDRDGFHDIDDCPTKTFMVDRRNEDTLIFAMSMGKRPAEELFAIKSDPHCLLNLADDPAHHAAKAELQKTLDAALTQQDDPRMRGSDVFDSYPRVSGMRPELGGFAEQGQYNPKYNDGK